MNQGAAIPGSGALLPGSVLVTDVAAIDFGDCVRGQASTRPLPVRNAGDTPVSGLGVAIDGAQGPAFEIAAGDCVDTLAPGAECTSTVTFTPDALGPQAAIAVLSASGANALRVALSGAGVAAGALTPGQTQIDFQTQEVGVASETQGWSVTNTGTTATGPLTLTNGDPTTFATTTNCGPPLPPGGSCNVTAQFVGERPGVASTSVSVTDGSSTAQTQLSVDVVPTLAIQINGPGRVQVTTVTESALPCDGGCRVLGNETVTITATPTNGSNSYFTGWTSTRTEQPACTGIQRQCQAYIAYDETLTANFTETESNLIFVSSETFTTDLGGSAPYDAACNRLATAAGINDATGTGYIAAVTGTQPFFDRIPPNVRGWIRLDGLPVADTLDMLRDTDAAGPFYPVVLDELGNPTRGFVLTGTSITGQAAANCDNWTPGSQAGALLASATSVNWGDSGGDCQGIPYRLFCMGVTKSARVVPQTFSGKRMWATATPLTLGGQTPDNFCQASRPSGVVSSAALIGYPGYAAADRLDPAATYVRPDGLLLGTGEEIRNGNFTTAPRIANDGSVLAGFNFVWTGGSIAQPPDASGLCGVWTDPTAIDGAYGYATETNGRVFAHGTGNCSAPDRVYCFEL